MDEAERTAAQRELIEELGLLYEQMGGTRMTGRVAGWLLLCDPPVQSLTEIAEGLGVSKAAVSGAARLLLQANVIERATRPGGRGDHYRALAGNTADLLQLDHVRALHDFLVRGLATVADRDQSQSNYALMHDALEFTAFMLTELPGLLARWYTRRAGDARPGDAPDPDPRTARPAGGST